MCNLSELKVFPLEKKNPVSEKILSLSDNLLTEKYIKNSLSFLEFDHRLISEAVKALILFKKYPRLKRYFLHCHNLLFIEKSCKAEETENWEILPEAYGEYRDWFYAFLMISGIDALKKQFDERKIPRAVLIDTLSDLELWIENNLKFYGSFGLKLPCWLCFHLTFRLFKLGRLQFLIEDFPLDIRVYRNRKNKKIATLAADKKEIRNDGQYNHICGISDPEPFFTKFNISNSKITGNPITPHGNILKNRISLDRNDWELCLQKNDTAISFHIPATGPMTFDECGKAFLLAFDFFRKYFPEKKFRTYFSLSWLYDNQLPEYLSPDSNIVRFQKEFFLVPLSYAKEKETLQWVFGNKKAAYKKNKSKTSLQRAILNFRKTGKRCRNGGALLFKEDFNWGKQVYQNQNARFE